MFVAHADALRSHGVTVLALNVDGLSVDGATDPGAEVDELLKQLGYNLPHGTARQENLAKIELLIEYLSSRRAPLSIPASFLIDARGHVAAIYRKAVRWDRLEKDLALLNAPAIEQLDLRPVGVLRGVAFDDKIQFRTKAALSHFSSRVARLQF